LTENDAPKNVVTQNVTTCTKNVTHEALVEALRDLPKEDLIRLLTAAITDR
jgi:hypothetical protein